MTERDDERDHPLNQDRSYKSGRGGQDSRGDGGQRRPKHVGNGGQNPGGGRRKSDGGTREDTGNR